ITITDLESLLQAFKVRVDYFDKAGCISSDHGLSAIPHKGKYGKTDIEKIFKEVLNGNDSKAPEIKESFTYFMLIELCKMYHEKGWVQQFHLGALRNSNAYKVSVLGRDTGFDSVGDYKQAETLSILLNELESINKLS